MGNTHRNKDESNIITSYQPQQWIRNDSQNPHIWKHTTTQQKAQLYLLAQPPSQRDIHIYQFRANHPYLVAAIHLSPPIQQLCIATTHSSLLLQYIPLDLSMLHRIDIEQAITILHSAFKGFNTLQEMFGGFRVSQPFIGFNQSGRTKVWLNKDYHSNWIPLEQRQTIRTQHQRVGRVVEMVMGRVKGKQLSEYIHKQLYSPETNYLKAIELIEEYSVEEELSLQRGIRTDLLMRKRRIQGHNRHSSSIDLLFTDRSNQSLQGLSQYQSIRQYHSPEPLPLHECGNKAEMPLRINTEMAAQSSRECHRANSPKPHLTFAYQGNKINIRQEEIPKTRLMPVRRVVQPKPMRNYAAQSGSQSPKITFNTSEYTAQRRKGQSTPMKKLIQQIQYKVVEKRENGQRKDIRKQERVVESIINKQKFQEETDNRMADPLSSLHINSNLTLPESDTFSRKLEPSAETESQVEVKPSDQTLQIPPKDELPNKQPSSKLMANFQSFGINNNQFHNFSLGPVQAEQPSPFIQTTNSIQIQDKHSSSSFESNSFQRRQSIQEDMMDEMRLVESGEERVVGSPKEPSSPTKLINFKQYNQINNQPQEEAIEDSVVHPFYSNYTAVESKFHIMKRDSSVQPERVAFRRSSAFNGLQEDGDDGRGIKVNRVESEYENTERNSQISQIQGMFKVKNSNAGVTPRSIVNKDIIQEDFLDVQFMEKSLDIKYKQGKQSIKKESTKKQSQHLEITQLQDKLSKFQISQRSLKGQSDVKDPDMKKNLPQRYPDGEDNRMKTRKIPSIDMMFNRDESKWSEREDGQIMEKKSSPGNSKKQCFYNTMELKEPVNSFAYLSQRTSATHSQNLKYYKSLPKYQQNRGDQFRKMRPQFDDSRSKLENRYQRYVRGAKSMNREDQGQVIQRKYKRQMKSELEADFGLHSFNRTKGQRLTSGISKRSRVSYQQLRSMLYP